MGKNQTVLDFKKLNWRAQKSCWTKRLRDLWLEDQVKEPRSGKVLRHPWSIRTGPAFQRQRAV